MFGTLLFDSTAFSHVATIGRAVAAPWPRAVDLNRTTGDWAPTHDPQTIFGVIAINQPSALFCVVPVFPAREVPTLNLVLTDRAVPLSTTNSNILRTA